MDLVAPRRSVQLREARTAGHSTAAYPLRARSRAPRPLTTAGTWLAESRSPGVFSFGGRCSSCQCRDVFRGFANTAHSGDARSHRPRPLTHPRDSRGPGSSRIVATRDMRRERGGSLLYAAQDQTLGRVGKPQTYTFFPPPPPPHLRATVKPGSGGNSVDRV